MMHALTCAVVCQADKRLYKDLLRGYGTQKLPLLMQHSQYLHRNNPMFKSASQMQQACVKETHDNQSHMNYMLASHIPTCTDAIQSCIIFHGYARQAQQTSTCFR